MKKTVMVLFALCVTGMINAQSEKTLKKDILSLKDFQFLKTLAEVVMDSSRIYPRQKIFDKASRRGRYLAIWIRDYTISLETGFMDK